MPVQARVVADPELGAKLVLIKVPRDRWGRGWGGRHGRHSMTHGSLLQYAGCSEGMNHMSNTYGELVSSGF
jgi:hypothetical protein